MKIKEERKLLRLEITRCKEYRERLKKDDVFNQKAYYEICLMIEEMAAKDKELRKLQELCEPPIISTKPTFNGLKQLKIPSLEDFTLQQLHLIHSTIANPPKVNEALKKAFEDYKEFEKETIIED